VAAPVLITARALTSVVVALAMTAVLLIIGWAAYGANVPGRTAGALVLDIVVGAAAFCCLGFALASVIHDADAAQPLTQAVTLPLLFISGVFIPTSIMPRWLTDVAAVFPVRRLASALLTAYNPHTAGAGFSWTDLLIVAAWGAAGLVIALRRFSWVPLGR
jgi:ABC-2 type transport system permease protein